MTPLAILGQGCVLPGALTPAALWEAVADGRDLTSGPPDGRWGVAPADFIAQVNERSPGERSSVDKTFGGRGGYVTGFERVWDPEGFAVPASMLAGLDPVFLWLLHSAREAWREAALAGVDPARVGVIVGNLSYPTRGLADFARGVWRGDPDEGGVRPENRFSSGYPAQLVAKALGLAGPAFALDAACASSLYAVKLAADLLDEGEIDAAIVGAVNACDNLFLHMGFSALGALSRSGASRPFSRRADGLLPAEGAAAVALVRAADVDPLRHSVHGVIRGLGISNDGRRRGLLAPDADGQREALARAYADGGVEPRAISLIECHATGTPGGDPVEVGMLAAFFEKAGDLPVGSLKSNTGHLITAAGLGGLLKLTGALAHETRPATLHAEDAIDAFAGPVRPLTKAEAWRAGEAPRRAGLSAFGFGGCNAHLVLEEWRMPARPARSAKAGKPHIDDIVICGVGASAGDARGILAILDRLEAPQPMRPSARRSEIVVDLAKAKLPPADLKKTLAQQTLVFEVVEEALRGVTSPAAERIGALIGMGCDAEAARWALRWRDAASASEKDSIVAPLDAAHVLGAMPNVPASRLTVMHDWRGCGFTVSAEELSGLEALGAAARLLRRGELDMAVVGAVDLGDEPVHTHAVRQLIDPAAVPGDAAVALVLKRRADAERDGDAILCALAFPAETGSDAGEDRAVGAALAARFGVAHAASGLLTLGVAAAAGARGRRIDDSGAHAWLEPAPKLAIAARSFSGRRFAAELAFTEPPRAMPGAGMSPRAAARTSAPAREPIGGEIAFVFTGAAAAYAGMGAGLLAAFPDAGRSVAARFGEAQDTAYRLAREPKLLADPFEQLRATTLISQVHAEIARDLLKLEPSAALGLSSGETNALLAFGAWRDPDALLAEVRASGMYDRWLAGRCEAAAMSWGVKPDAPIAWRCWRILAPVDTVREAVRDAARVTLSIVAGPNDCVIAGEAEACRRVMAKLPGAPAMPLGQDMVVHCAEAAPFADEWRRIHRRETRPVEGVRFYANALNAAYTPTRETAAEMLTEQAVQPVDFTKTVLQAWRDGVRVFVELGPRDSLTRAIGEILAGKPHVAVALDRFGVDDVAQIAEAADVLAAAGVAIDIDVLDARLATLATDAAPAEPHAAAFALPAHPPAVPKLAAKPPSPKTTPTDGSNVIPLRPAPRLARPVEVHASARLVAIPGGAAQRLAPAPKLALVTALRGKVAPPPPGGEGAGGGGPGSKGGPSPMNRPPLSAPPPLPLPRKGGGGGPPPRSETAASLPPSSRPAAPNPERAPTGPAFSRAQLEAAARGKISDLFGPTFARQDGYRRQVRMPAPPLLLADRVTGIDAAPGVPGKGTTWTETDVVGGDWRTHAGRLRPGLVIESGQADLLLASYMGADFLNRDERVYRLLGCELTFHDGGLPAVGETLRFQINIERHANLGDVRLFFFNYDAHVGVEGESRPLLSVRNGQAGFFTDAELASSSGVLWDAENAAPPTPTPRLAPLPHASQKRAFTGRELDAFFAGDARACFGAGFERACAHQRTPAPPSGRLRLIDSVEAFEPPGISGGGPWKRGYLRAAAAAPAGAWFYDGHFHNDPCMPGTLMAEAAVQAIELFMVAAGLTIERDGWRFEPMPGEAYKFLCRGQVVPDRDHRLTYEVFVDEIVDAPDGPIVYAALLARSDGFKVFACPRFGVRLTRDWPISDRKESALLGGERSIVSPKGDVGGDFGALMACAWGPPSDAFGSMYERFDRESGVPRLPGPPYHFVSRIVSVSHPPGAPAKDINVVAEYAPPADAWYFDANGHAVMPFSVLMEVLLQPCGWLASYCGFALEGGLAFRNLDGEKAIVQREVRPGDGPLRVTTKLTKWSKAGPLTIVFFDVACRIGDDVVMSFGTSFGFFPKAALAAQAGLPNSDALRARLTEKADPKLASPPKVAEGRAPIPRAPLAMVDAITGFWPDGGEVGLGRLRGRQVVDPCAWYFKAHFYEDPVQPGSLGVEALLQLLEHAMRLKGLDRDFAAPRFETPALGLAMTWKYRGQVTPEAKEVVTTLDVTAIERGPDGVLATAKASLWADGLRIYEADGLSARIVEGEPARTKRETLSLGRQPWLADHRPTYTVPALPMMGVVALLGGLAQESAAAPFPLLIEDLTLSRWIAVGEAAVALEVRAEPRGAGRFSLSLDFDGAPAARGWARVGGKVGDDPAPPTSGGAAGRLRGASPDAGDLPPIANAEARPLSLPAAPPKESGIVADLYLSGGLFHGPRFHLLTDVHRSCTGARATLDVTGAFDPAAELDIGLLDALLHAIPHDAPEQWFGAAAVGKAAYPHTVERLAMHRPRPKSGSLSVLAHPLDASGDGRFVRIAVSAEDKNGPWLDLTLREVLMPKGPLGRLAPADRRAFLAEGRFTPGAGLSQTIDGETRLALADVRASDWLPGTLAAAYRLTGAPADSPREIAIKEHAARLWRVHPRDIAVTDNVARLLERRLAVEVIFDAKGQVWRVRSKDEPQ